MTAAPTITVAVKVLQVTPRDILVQPRGGDVDSRCWIRHAQLTGPVPAEGAAEITIPKELAKTRGVAR